MQGDRLTNPVTGQVLIFRRPTADTGGDLLEVESIWERVWAPSRPPLHYHPVQEERFEVLEGRLRVKVNGDEKDLATGDTLVLPPGTPHEMWAPYGRVRARWETRPALMTERLFETLWNLAADGRVTGAGIPSLIRLAPIARQHAREIRLSSPPWAVQRIVFTLLAPLAWALGYRAHYDSPSGRRAGAGALADVE
jgi:hypothetical protein